MGDGGALGQEGGSEVVIAVIVVVSEEEDAVLAGRIAEVDSLDVSYFSVRDSEVIGVSHPCAELLVRSSLVVVDLQLSRGQEDNEVILAVKVYLSSFVLISWKVKC